MLKIDMNLVLKRFEESDLKLLESWRKKIHSDQFMSRVTPENYKHGNSVLNNLWDWYTIHQNDLPIGTSWLEKKNHNSQIAKLGILLGATELFGQGIGTKTIMLLINNPQNILNFKIITLNVRKTNQRAIACYRKCGFNIMKEGKKINNANKEIEFYTMQTNI